MSRKASLNKPRIADISKRKVVRFAGKTEYSAVRTEVTITRGFTDITSETDVPGEQMHIRLAGDNFSDIFEKLRMTSSVMLKVIEQATKDITALSSDVVRDDFGW